MLQRLASSCYRFFSTADVPTAGIFQFLKYWGVKQHSPHNDKQMCYSVGLPTRQMLRSVAEHHGLSKPTPSRWNINQAVSVFPWNPPTGEVCVSVLCDLWQSATFQGWKRDSEKRIMVNWSISVMISAVAAVTVTLITFSPVWLNWGILFKRASLSWPKNKHQTSWTVREAATGTGWFL